MNKKKLAVVGAFVALTVALAATASSLVYVCRKVRAFEAEHGGSVYANLSKAQMDEIVKAKIKQAATNTAPASATDESTFFVPISLSPAMHNFPANNGTSSTGAAAVIR